VKWKGFPHEGNTWQKRKDISLELVEGFEAGYQGNHLGIRISRNEHGEERLNTLLSGGVVRRARILGRKKLP
jgi:hypothetical protein